MFALLAASACQVGTGEIKVNSVRLAKGELRNLVWGGAQVERFHVVARRGSENEAVIWSPDHRSPCSLGPVAGYEAIQPLRTGGIAWGSLGKGVVPFIESLDDNKRGTLRFSSIDCTPLPLEVPDVNQGELWTIYDPSLVKPTYVARLSDLSLLLIDPWLGSTKRVAQNVTAIAVLDNGLWLVENGEAVRRDAKGKELERTGHDVTELMVMGEHQIAYVDKNGLFRFVSGTGAKLVAKDACRPRMLSGLPGGSLAYFSPCATRRLVIDYGGTTESVAENIVQLMSASGFLVYTLKGDSTTTMWLADLSLRTGLKAKVDQVAERETFDLDRMWLRTSQKLLVSIAQNNLLELWEIDTKQKKATPLAGQDKLTSVRVGADTYVTISSDGELLLRRMHDLGPELRRQGVPNGSVRWMFGDSSAAIGYLSNVDPDTKLGRLELHFVEDGAHYNVAENAAELHEVWWPETGIVYATGPGKNEGLWFAHVDVPCEKSASSPWACAF